MRKNFDEPNAAFLTVIGIDFRQSVEWGWKYVQGKT